MNTENNHSCTALPSKAKPGFVNAATYVNKFGDTTFIIGNCFTGTKTLADTFEEIIVTAYRQKYVPTIDKYAQSH